MKLDVLQVRLRHAVSAHYAARYPAKGVTNEVPGFEARLEKLRRVQQRISKHQRVYDHWEVRDRVTANVREAKALLDGGHRFLSLDVEANLDNNRIHEIGGTIFDKDDHKSFNWQIVGSIPKGISFLFGKTEYMSLAEARDRLVEVCEGVDFYVGQSLDNDFKVLSANKIAIARRTFYDTAHWSVLIQPSRDKTLKLSELMEAFKLVGIKYHNAGNDSNYAMKVFNAFIQKYT